MKKLLLNSKPRGLSKAFETECGGDCEVSSVAEPDYCWCVAYSFLPEIIVFDTVSLSDFGPELQILQTLAFTNIFTYNTDKSGKEVLNCLNSEQGQVDPHRPTDLYSKTIEKTPFFHNNRTSPWTGHGEDDVFLKH